MTLRETDNTFREMCGLMLGIYVSLCHNCKDRRVSSIEITVDYLIYAGHKFDTGKLVRRPQL
jgi:hypothetical protein